MRLPPELCDETIDYLWDDVDALRACSLTCQAWLPASRFHLFRNLRLRNADDVSRFRALLSAVLGSKLAMQGIAGPPPANVRIVYLF